MFDCRVDGINIFNPIENKFKEIIEYFVKFYGEKYRKRIVERLTNSTVLFLGNVNSNANFFTENSVKTYFEEKIYDINKKFLEKIGCDKSKTCNLSFFNFKNILKDLDYIQYASNETAGFCLALLNSAKMIDLPEDLQINEYRDFLKNNLKQDNINNFLQSEIVKIKKIWEESFEHKVKETLLEKEKTVNVLNRIELDLKSAVQKIDDEISNLIGEFILKKFGKDINLLGLNNKKKIVSCFKNLIEKKHIFFTDYDKKSCVEVFKYLGLNGKTFEDFVKDKNLKNFLKDKTFLESYWNFKALVEEEINYNCVYVKEAVAELKKLNLLINPDVYSLVIQEFVIDNFSIDGQIFTLADFNKNLHCVCLLKQYLNLDTATLVHEFNHIVESDRVTDKNGNFLGFKTGFKMNSSRYSLLDEVINDYISMKIFKLMENDNFRIGFYNNIPSDYSRVFPVIKDFIEENLQNIIECRMSNDPLMFAKKIGRNNFDLLNDAVNVYFDIGDKKTIASAMEELKEFKGDLDDIEDRKRLSKNSAKLYDVIFTIDYIKNLIKNKNLSGDKSPELLK